MDEPRTHYQVSFTSRQGLAVFVAIVVSLVLAYFLGLMTGLAGGDSRPAAAVPQGPTPVEALAAAPEAPFPAPVLGVAGRTPVSRGAVPTAVRVETPAAAPTPSVQLFEDRASSEPTRLPAPAVRAPAPGRPTPVRPSARAPEPAKFWVQVDSLSSKDQAQARRRNMAAAGFAAVVVPGVGAKGTLYRVRVGPYLTREDADRAKETLARKAKVANPWVVPPGQ